MEKTLVLLKTLYITERACRRSYQPFREERTEVGRNENDAIDRCDIDEHYAHLREKSFFSDFKGFHDVNSRDCMLLRRY